MTPKTMDLRTVAKRREYRAVPTRQLMQWAAEGRLSPDDLVRADDTSSWSRVAEVPLLAAQLPTSSARGPAAPGKPRAQPKPSAAATFAGSATRVSGTADAPEHLDLDSLGSVASSDQWPTQALEDPEMDMLPMIDVIFQLLIFFMFSNQLANPNPIETPEAVYGLGVTPDGRQMILVDGEGHYFLGESTVPEARVDSVETVVRTVAENAGQLGGTMPVTINAHKQARHRSVRELVEALSGMREVGEIKLGVEEKR
jgi:biopolymer transport protein ExbD